MKYSKMPACIPNCMIFDCDINGHQSLTMQWLTKMDEPLETAKSKKRMHSAVNKSKIK